MDTCDETYCKALFVQFNSIQFNSLLNSVLYCLMHILRKFDFFSYNLLIHCMGTKRTIDHDGMNKESS